ncbi:MAG: hypothetical protein V1754_04970, partial [Pseudomonadota bacterium]
MKRHCAGSKSRLLLASLLFCVLISGPANDTTVLARTNLKRISQAQIQSKWQRLSKRTSSKQPRFVTRVLRQMARDGTRPFVKSNRLIVKGSNGTTRELRVDPKTHLVEATTRRNGQTWTVGEMANHTYVHHKYMAGRRIKKALKKLNVTTGDKILQRTFYGPFAKRSSTRVARVVVEKGGATELSELGEIPVTQKETAPSKRILQRDTTAPLEFPHSKKRRRFFGETIVDKYDWLQRKDSSPVLAYLDIQNAAATAHMAKTRKLQNRIYREITKRIPQKYITVPYKNGDYYYYKRESRDKSYPIFARRKGSIKGREEILLDVNS